MKSWNIFLVILGCFVLLPSYIECAGYKLNIAGRPAQPWPKCPNYNPALTAFTTNNPPGPNYPITTAYHHIVPFNSLIGFWNKAVTASVKDRKILSLGMVAVLDALNTKTTNANVRKVINGLKNESIVHDASSTNTPDGWDDFTSYFAYLPGDTFLGPTARTDDPHSGFETGAGVIAGTTKFAYLKAANASLAAFLQITTPTQKDVQGVAPKLSLVIASGVDWFKLDSKTWVPVGKAPNYTYKLATSTKKGVLNNVDVVDFDSGVVFEEEKEDEVEN